MLSVVSGINEAWRNRLGRCVLNADGSGDVPVAGSCERCNETSEATKGGEFLEQLWEI
jgi:hypothetical protein